MGRVIKQHMLSSSALLSLFLITAFGNSHVNAVDSLPPNHPGADLIKNFGGQIRCPHADLWLTKGPEQAAIELGLDSILEDHEKEATSHRSLKDQPDDSSTRCTLAPGPAGGAHQAPFSTGYQSDCPGTPAEGSPYQWPLMWSAHVKNQAVAFQSDEIIFEQVGKVWYRLDKNWKRFDTFYSRGVQRAVGQNPCTPENTVSIDPVIACRRDTDIRNTMLHRNNAMYFIYWKEGTTGDDVANIDSCVWIDLRIVGNVRPDWYMDARGAITDVQYLGDQHLYYEGVPKLVKQWRKKDFANQYFVMSMLANTGDDGIHWPLILDVPGEGFGDDFLQKFTNHSLLTEQDEDMFFLDQALEAAGGTCPQIFQRGDRNATRGKTHIPSNLEVDPNSWCSREYTFSPVWVPPSEETNNETTEESSEKELAVIEVDAGTVGSCYDTASGSVQLQLNLNGIEVSDAGIPWMALGYRKDAKCLMNPIDGSDTDIILIGTNPSTGLLSASKGAMSAIVRSNPGAAGMIYPTLSALEDTDGYSNVKVSTLRAVDGADSANVTLDFSQDFDAKPEVMYLMYAIGTSPQLGYHTLRQCFELTQFPDCKVEAQTEDHPDLEPESSGSVITKTSALTMVITAIFSLCFF